MMMMRTTKMMMRTIMMMMMVKVMMITRAALHKLRLPFREGSSGHWLATNRQQPKQRENTAILLLAILGNTRQ